MSLDVKMVSDDRLHIFIPSKVAGDLYFQMHSLKRQLPDVVVQVSANVFLNMNADGSQREFHLLKGR